MYDYLTRLIAAQDAAWRRTRRDSMLTPQEIERLRGELRNEHRHRVLAIERRKRIKYLIAILAGLAFLTWPLWTALF